MIRASGFLKLITFMAVTILMGVIAFIQPTSANGGQSELEQSQFIQTPHIQSALAELAEAVEKPGACFETGSMEKCAACCRDFMTTCISLVIPLCHQGDPSRNEFRHCIKNKEDRCKSDHNNCAWMCRRTK
jgi:hypothetical protein